jgi:general secretion pathway protein E
MSVASPPSAPRLLNDCEEVEIAPAIRDYVAIVSEGDVVTIHVDQERRGNPAVGSLRRFFERREDRYPRVEVVGVPFDEIGRVVAKYGIRETDTVSLERQAIDILRIAAKVDASDLHVKQLHNGMAIVQFRVDGDIVPAGIQMSRDEGRSLCTAFFTMADASGKKGSYAESSSQAAAIIGNLPRYGLEAWFSALRLQFNSAALGPELAARLQPLGQTARALDRLGLSATQVDDLVAMVHAPHGALLISGPTGSGKSGTVAALVDHYTGRHPEKRALTIEDPVEIKLAGASQYSINEQDHEKRPKRLTAMLRDMLRSDFDLIMLQECRDPASAAAFLEVSITGRLGLSTIHTPTPSMIVQRLRGWGIDDATLRDPGTIVGLVGVRLCKVLCPHCKIPLEEALAGGGEAAEELARALDRMQVHSSWAFGLRRQDPPNLRSGFTRRGSGCGYCRQESVIRRPGGTAGRSQLAEVIPTDAVLLDHLVSGRFEAAQRYLRQTLGVPSLFEDAIGRVARGMLCPLDAEAVLGYFPVPAQPEALRLAAE